MLVPSAGIRGFLDASEFGTWLKFVRRTSGVRSNVRHVLLGGQIFYQTVGQGAGGRSRSRSRRMRRSRSRSRSRSRV